MMGIVLGPSPYGTASKLHIRWGEYELKKQFLKAF
jgi:hypothetical protein